MMRDWLKLAVREGAEEVGKGKKIWRVRKSEKVDFKAQKKLTAGERKLSYTVGMSRTSDCGGAVCVRSEGS